MSGLDRPTEATHVMFGSGRWALWKPVLVRAPGLPADGALRLAAPALAGAADSVAENRENTAACERYREIFADEAARLSEELRYIVADPWFRSALTWQNHHATARVVDWFLRRRPEVNGRNSRYRQNEALLANYWQRYCVKNDSIGFFGPVGWGRLDSDRPRTELRHGPALTSRSEVFFETWAIDRLVSTIDITDGMRKWLAPRLSPFVRIVDDHACAPGVAPMPLSSEELTVLRFCDGTTTAWTIAEKLVGTLEKLTCADEVYALLAGLNRRRVISWRLDLPLSMRPENDLRRLLSDMSDPVASSGLAALDRLESARDGVRQAQDDPDDLERALNELDAVFHELTGVASHRNPGRTYGGRTLVYLDALRDMNLTVGRDVVDRLVPLELLLHGVRWFTHEVAREFTRSLRELVRERRAEEGVPVTLAWLWMNGVPLMHGPDSEIPVRVRAELRRRWESVLAPSFDVAHVRYDSDQLRTKVEEAFSAPGPGWTGARYCSPDLMVSARDAEAFRAGDFDLVLGEIHMAVNTLRSAFQVDRHPNPRELFDCVTAETPGPRLYPVLPKENGGRLSARTHPSLIRDRDFLAMLFEQTVDPARPRLLRAADLEVESAGDRLLVTAPGGHRFDVLDVFSELLMNAVGDGFDLFTERTHTPRVSFDRLVVARESWSFTPEQLPFATTRDEAIRFAQARQWQRDNALPRWVFAKTSATKKPFFVDFESPIYVGILMKAVRVVGDDRNGSGRVYLTEMLPALENLWFEDADTSRYTSELRLAVVDLANA